MPLTIGIRNSQVLLTKNPESINLNTESKTALNALTWVEKSHNTTIRIHSKKVSCQQYNSYILK